MKKYLIKVWNAYVDSCNKTWLDFARAYCNYDIK